MSNTEIDKVITDLKELANEVTEDGCYLGSEYIAGMIFSHVENLKKIKSVKDNLIPISSLEELYGISPNDLLLWDGEHYHLDFVEVSPKDGTYYFANHTDATHYKILQDGPKS